MAQHKKIIPAELISLEQYENEEHKRERLYKLIGGHIYYLMARNDDVYQEAYRVPVLANQLEKDRGYVGLTFYDQDLYPSSDQTGSMSQNFWRPHELVSMHVRSDQQTREVFATIGYLLPYEPEFHASFQELSVDQPADVTRLRER